jgi:hypothetical protein
MRRSSTPLRSAETSIRAVVLFATILFAASACGPAAPEIPAPRLAGNDSLHRGFLENGASVAVDRIGLRWEPVQPVRLGTDIFVLEISDLAGDVKYSRLITPASTVYFSQGVLVLPDPEMDAAYPGQEEYIMRIECGRSYTWHIRQVEGLNMSPWSDSWSFQMAPAPRSAPSPVAPADGARIASGSIQWIGFSGPPDMQYSLRMSEVRDTVSQGQVIDSPNSFGPLESQHAYALHSGSTYYWQVRAFRTEGCEGPWSAARSFVWLGPDVAGPLPADASMAAPAPICTGGDCATATSAGTPLPSVTPAVTPSAATKTSTLPPNPTDTSTPLPAPSCGDYDSNPTKCKAAGCYYWSNGACQINPEPPPPSCSDYSGLPDKCKNAGCYYWSDGTCSSASEPPPPPSCGTYFDQSSCQKAGCAWNGKQQTCGPA